MKQKLLFLVALLALAVNIAVAVNYVPGNDLKLLGKSEKAEVLATLQIDESIKANRSHKKGAAIMLKSADEGWGEWEAFAPGGFDNAVWTLTAWQTGQLNVKTYVRTSTADATKKQIKCEGWGAGFFTEAGVDILLDWNTTDNSIEITMQSTGYYNSNYKDYVVVGTFGTGKYDPEQGKFSFHVGYSVPQYYVMGQGFGFGDETLQMAGQFKDYSISFSRGTVDDEATPIKQTVNVVPGEDVTSYRVHADTYENYLNAQGSAAYFEALAKAEGTDYTASSATVELQGSDYNIYVVVVSAFANGEMKKYDYAMYEVSPASDWETIGTRPYREDIVTSLYNFGQTGPVYDVEVQKHKTYNVYRIKNPYGSTSPFSKYTSYENAYLYLNAQDPTMVLPAFQWSKCDLGIDIEGGVPLDVFLADKTIGGTYDGYAISFPTKALASTNYYVNTNGLFRAVINFRDTEFAFADDAKSVYTGEIVKITSNNILSTPTFESLTPEIATVDAKGVVTAVVPGKAQIKVVQDAYLEFNAKEAVMEIDVAKNPNSYASFVFNTDEGLAALGVEKPADGKAMPLTGMTLISGDVSMTTTDGGTATRVWCTLGTTDLRMYKSGGSFTISVPEGYQIISIDFTGTECSLFGDKNEFETCTKTNTVWNAPEGESVTSKTFAATGTCKINAIKVKYLAPQATVYYSQDYENGAEADWSTQVGGRFDPEIGEEAGGNHYLRAAAGTRTSNGTGMYTNAYSEKLAAGTPFTMTADIHLRSANGQNGVEFAVGAAGASYSFSKWALTGTMTLNMKQVATGGTDQWILNGDTDNPITLPGTGTLAGTNAADIYDAAPWYSIQLTWQDGLTLFSIKNKATGEVIVDKTQLKNNDSFASVGGVGQLWFSTSRYNAAFAIDNVVIRDIIDEDLPGVVAPTKNAVAIKIDDKKSSQDGYYTFRATIEEPEDGDAEGYIMLLSKDAEPDTNPADGVAYVEGNEVGNSKVYASSGTVYNLSGLESGVYYAKAFAYKTGAQGPKYLIDGAPMASVATPKAGTTAPDSLWVRSTAATSIGLGVKGNAAGQTIIVAACDSTYNPGNYGTRPYPGNLSATSKKNDLILDENGKQVGKVIYVGVPTPGGGTTFTASSLKASTPYYFVAYASDGEQLSWDPDFVQVWATTEITVPYSVAPSKAPENNQPVGWTSEPGGEYEGFFVQKANIGGDNLHPTQIPVLQGTNTHFEANDWTASLTSPEVTLTKDCKYTFKWRMDEKGNLGMAGAGHGPENWAKEGEYLKFEVICEGDTTLAKTYTRENAPECLANKEWVNEAIDLSAYSGKKVQVKMTWRCEFANGVDMFLDCLSFEQYAVTPTKAPSLSFVKRHLSSSFELTADIVQPAEPDADGYVMLVSKNAAPDTTPVEGVMYNNEDALGNAVVSIHTGRLMSENISPIEEGATYYVAVYPYNTGNGGPKYLIEGAPLGTVVVPTADLFAPAEFKVLDEQQYTDKISFSVKANEANQIVIVAYSDSTCNPGNLGSQAAVGEINAATAKAGDQLYDATGNPCGKIAYVGSTGEFTVEGLLPSTSYYFTAFSANDKAVSWSPDYINCWAATKGVAPYEVNMAATPAGGLPAGWTTTPEGENKGFYKQRNGLTKNLPPSGNPDVFYSTAPTALDEEAHTATLTSPVISLTNGNTLSFDWLTLAWGRFSNTGYGPSAWNEEDIFKVELLDGENVVELKSYNKQTALACLDNLEYASESIDLSAYAGKDVQFRIVWHSLAVSQVYLYLDAFKVSVPPTYTLNYVHDGDGAVLKDPVVLNTTVGAEVTASSADMASFFNADNTMKYIYKEGNTTIVAGKESASNVITLVYRDAAKLKYTVKSTGLPEGYEYDFTPYANPGDKFAEQWEGELVSVAYPEFILVGDSLWYSPAVNKAYNKEWTITAASKETVEYTDNYTVMDVTNGNFRNISFFKEGEEIWPEACAAPNQYVRCSNGRAGAPALNEMAEIVTLPAGIYRVGMQFAQASTAAQKETFDLFIGEDLLFQAAVYGYVQSYQTPEFTVTEDTKLYLKGLTVDGGGLDWIYVQKVGRVPANLAVEPASISMLGIGEKATLTWTADNAATPVFESSDVAVVSVDETGEVESNGKGEATISVILPATDSYYADTVKVAVTVKVYGTLPALASNAYYSWQSPMGTVEEVGGSAVASEADPSRVNYSQAPAYTQYYTISLNGKKDLSDDKYTTVTLEKSLAEGDTIIVYAFKNKGEVKKSGVKFFWGEEGTESAMACGDDFPDIYSEGEPTVARYVVPKEAAGQSVFRMSRSETGTNLFIAQLQIVPNQATGINDISAKNAQLFGEGTYDVSGRKVINPIKDKVYIVNGKKYIAK